MNRAILTVVYCLLLLALSPGDLRAQQPTPTAAPPVDRLAATEVTLFRLPWEALPVDEQRQLAEAITANPHHPLLPAVDYAQSVADDIHRHVRDYTCILIKCERIQERLQDFQSMRVRLRRWPAGGR